MMSVLCDKCQRALGLLKDEAFWAALLAVAIFVLPMLADLLGS